MIDFREFEEKTKGGYDWEVIVPEDGLIRVILDNGEKTYLFINEGGDLVGYLPPGGLPNDSLDLVPREAEWRAGWRPEYSRYYYSVHGGQTLRNSWVNDPVDKYRKMCGNCYPDTPRGKLLAEARAKYEPLIGEIAGMDEPEGIFRYIRSLGPKHPCWADTLDNMFGKGPLHANDLRAAIRWLDSGYRLTIEEAES